MAELIAGGAARIIWYANPSPLIVQPAWPPPPPLVSLTGATVVMKITNPAGVETTVVMTPAVDSFGNQYAYYDIQPGDFPAAAPGIYVLEMWATPPRGSQPYKTSQRAVQVGASS